jgi:hypothetical protein
MMNVANLAIFFTTYMLKFRINTIHSQTLGAMVVKTTHCIKMLEIAFSIEKLPFALVTCDVDVFFRLACSIFYKATTVTSSFTCNVVF